MSATNPVPSASHCTSPPQRPVAVQYLSTFLKPEMLHVYRQITALRAFRPVVICQKRENAAAFPFDDLRVLPKARTHAFRRVWQKQILGRPITIYRSEAARISRVLEEVRAKVLHIYFGHIGVHLLPLVETSPVPVVVSFHGADAAMETPAQLALTRRMFDHATLLLARSEALAQGLIELGADPGKVRVHRTGIPLEQMAFHVRATPPDGAWHCIQASRLIGKKGLTTTLRAFREFSRSFPAARLTIAGDGPQKEELQALALQLDLADRITFTGFLSQAALQTLYASGHFFLHPSETSPGGDREGIPNSMLEAMATGLPVISTTHGGIPEAVEHGVSGWLVPERDDRGIARALLELAASPARYAQMSAAAAQHVTERFDLSRQARALEECYSETVRSV